MKHRNKASVFSMMGDKKFRKDDSRAILDFYATPPPAVEALLEVEKFSQTILEPAVGMGHIAKVLEEHGYSIIGRDIKDYGYKETRVKDFLSSDKIIPWDIVTNPPYELADEFIKKAMDLLKPGRKMAMFLKVMFIQSKQRKALFEIYPPKVMYVICSRVRGGKNGEFPEGYYGGAVQYCWLVWEKGFTGDPVIKWIDVKK